VTWGRKVEDFTLNYMERGIPGQFSCVVTGKDGHTAEGDFVNTFCSGFF